MLLSWVGSYGRIKRKMTIGKNTDVQKVGTKNLEELAKLTILNILSTKGIIYTHYKNKRMEANEKKENR
tara:strand:- start:339 stop:545 length:207 start_codon:yes stop_codon:yes gene_type:complete